MALKRSFFERDTTAVAQDLLGKFLVRHVGRKTIVGMIVETEAYVGPHDLACHAAKGKTERTKVMFEPAGTWYVYLIYGMYHCLNIVTEAEDYPSAVLIRAIELPDRIGSGPGKLCRALKINKQLNCVSAVAKNAKLYIEDQGIKIPKNQIIKTKRVGVDYAGPWKNKPLRFYIKNNVYISKK
jgi:DNA-3-methyladenine glycosylase